MDRGYARAVCIEYIHIKFRFALGPVIYDHLNPRDFGLGNFESRPHLGPSGFKKLNRSGLVPNNIVWSQTVHENGHKKRIAHHIEGSAKLRADDIAIEAIKLHLNLDKFKPWAMIAHGNAGPNKGGIKIQRF